MYKQHFSFTKAVIIVWLALQNSNLNAQASGPHSLFLKTIAGISKVKTLRYRLVLNERIKDEMKTNSYLTKVNVSPYKVYTYSLTRNIGAEALYLEGKNNNEVLVNPNRFPWINLNLSINNMLIRKGHYFRIDQSGFEYISKVFMHYYRTDSAAFVKSLKLMGDTMFDGHLCSRLVLSYPDFHWKTYTALKGETITTVAEKLFVNDYMVLERNGKTSYSDLHEGEKIIVPEVFAKKIIITIDRASMLPLQQVLYDDKGLFAVIEFKGMIYNQPIPDEEFSSAYKSYGF